MQSALDGAQVLDEGTAEDTFQNTSKRGRKRAVYQDHPETSLRRRTSARDVLPIDDEIHQYFPCPVAACKAVFHNRAERSFHIRTDHVGYKYKPGDGMEKMQNIEQVNYEEDDAILDVGSISEERKPLADDPLSDYSEEHEQRYQMALGQHKPPTWHGSHMMSGPSHHEPFIIDRISKKHGEIDTNTFSANTDLYRETDSGPKRRGRPKNPPGSEPGPTSKVRLPDPNGKYRCYIPDCPWKGGYRSIRAEHMKWVHKDWKMPPRYVLQRMSRDGVFYNKEPEGDFTCLVDGCPWRGNYRASRSSHMRSQHPEWQPAKKKAPTGGYIEDGKYLCHDTNCGWRGASRSTRAAHMKRAHPGFLNPVCQPRMLLCPDCNVQCCTHKTFVDHLVDHHKIGGSVRREFTGIQDYEEWYEAVQDAFSVEFIKKMGVKQNESYQITYLYCARGGGTTRLKQVKQHPYSSQYVKMKNLARPFRSRNHCAAFLRVLHWTDGKLTVYGCAEHTGHRLGTAILRLSPTERDIMEEFIYVNDDENPMEQMLYKFKEVENYVVEGYPLPLYDEAVLTESMLDKNNERLSLKSLVQTFPAGSTFNVSIPEKIIADGEVFDLSLGIMTDEMKELWKVYGSKVVCFEEVRLIIGNWNLSLIFVLVFAEDNSPRCCCIYLSNVSDRIAVLKHLSEISLHPPQALITDHLQEWPLILESVYGDAAYSVELLTADWHLLAEWADSLDKIVQNRVDRFTIFACLRRWLRVTDPALFDAYIVEMFEAFRELNLDDMTHRIDMALIDPENFKRWNPLSRTTPLTEHHNPIVDIAYRHFREHFLNAESCTRLDQYIGLLMSRIPIFNKCITSEPVAHGIIEPMRQLPISENISSPSATVLADGSIIMHEDNSEELIIESELDENGHPYIVDEKDGIIGSVIQEEIVEEFTEEIGEEEIVDMSDMPSTSGIVYEEQSEYIDPSSNSYELVEEIPNDANHARKKRVSILLQTIQKNPSSLTGHHLDLLENSLSQVVDQLDHSAQPQ